MRLREKFGASPKKEPIVPKVDSVEEAVRLTKNGTTYVEVNGSLEPHKPSSADTTKPSAIDPGNINNETILTAKRDQSVEEMVGFLKGDIPNPNVESPKGNGSQNGK